MNGVYLHHTGFILQQFLQNEVRNYNVDTEICADLHCV